MKLFRALCVFACVLCVCGVSVAEDLSFWDDSIFGKTSTVIDNFKLGANLGFFMNNENIQSDLAYQGYVEYALNPKCALRTTLVYIDAEPDYHRLLSRGDFEMLGVEFAVLHMFPKDSVTKYLGAGAGSYMPDNEPQFAGNDDLDNGLGWFVMGGIEWSVGDIVSIECGAKYLFLEVQDRSEFLHQDVNLDMLLGSAGFKWDF